MQTTARILRERDVHINLNEETDAVGEVKVVDEKVGADAGKVDEELGVGVNEAAVDGVAQTKTLALMQTRKEALIVVQTPCPANSSFSEA